MIPAAMRGLDPAVKGTLLYETGGGRPFDCTSSNSSNKPNSSGKQSHSSSHFNSTSGFKEINIFWWTYQAHDIIPHAETRTYSETSGWMERYQCNIAAVSLDEPGYDSGIPPCAARRLNSRFTPSFTIGVSTFLHTSSDFLHACHILYSFLYPPCTSFFSTRALTMLAKYILIECSSVAHRVS